MQLETLRAGWIKGKATNFTGASFTDLKSTKAKPSGDGVFDLNSLGATTCNALLFRFWGTDTNNETFKVRIWGVAEWKDPASDVISYEWTLLAELLCTLGNIQGTAGCMIGSSDFEVDTITLTYGNDDVAISIVSPANDVRGAYALVDTLGHGIVVVDGDRNSSAASWNFGMKRQ